MTAANEAFEADLDQVVSLGWAHVEAHAFRSLLQAAQEAPQSLKAPLQLLASLYGLTRLEHSMAHYLAAGLLQGADSATCPDFAYDCNQHLSFLASHGSDTGQPIFNSIFAADALLQKTKALENRSFHRITRAVMLRRCMFCRHAHICMTDQLCVLTMMPGVLKSQPCWQAL